MAACLILFWSLTVTVDETGVRLRFGPGPIHRHVRPDEILSVHAMRLPWWAIAFGLRMNLKATKQLWRVSGWWVVDLKLTDDRELYIGTDRPDELAAVIRAAIAPQPFADEVGVR